MSIVAIAEAPSERLVELPVETPARKSGSSPRLERIANIIVLALLFAVPALMCVHSACVDDPDFWWHLRTGEWILNHHAVPQIDPFSRQLAGKPWQAYSWLFEVIVTKLYARLGLVGVVAYTSAMVLAVTVALYQMVRRMQADFSVAAVLTFGAGYSIGHLYSPRPWMFTILLFVLELSVLMHVRRTGRLRALLMLPLIFALWANIHIEYIDGLAVLGLAFVESVVARWWAAAETRVKPLWMGAALVASLLATLANPYGWRVYSVVFNYGSRLATSDSALNRVSELQSIPFRDASDFVVLLLAMLSVGALAWHRRLVLFEPALLVFATFAAFRSRRDIWLIAAVSAAILASRIVVVRKNQTHSARFAIPIAAAIASVALWAGFRLMHVDNAKLQAQVAKTLPVDAVKAIRAHNYAGPLYDDYNWGGYLIWALRMPVSMDGRASFYGDDLIDRSTATWNGEPDWKDDPQFRSAGLVVGPAKAPLTQLLRKESGYQLVYEDKMAAVFIARK